MQCLSSGTRSEDGKDAFRMGKKIGMNFRLRDRMASQETLIGELLDGIVGGEEETNVEEIESFRFEPLLRMMKLFEKLENDFQRFEREFLRQTFGGQWRDLVS